LQLGDKNEFQRFVFLKIYSKVLVEIGEFERAFTMIQVEYAKNTNINLLYIYGKLVVKSQKTEFFGSAQSALIECLKNGSVSAAFYLAKSFEISHNRIKAIQFYQ
jgi:hypothetical protein